MLGIGRTRARGAVARRAPAAREPIGKVRMPPAPKSPPRHNAGPPASDAALRSRRVGATRGTARSAVASLPVVAARRASWPGTLCRRASAEVKKCWSNVDSAMRCFFCCVCALVAPAGNYFDRPSVLRLSVSPTNRLTVPGRGGSVGVASNSPSSAGTKSLPSGETK